MKQLRIFKLTLQLGLIFALLSGYAYANAPLKHVEGYVDVAGGKIFYVTIGSNSASPMIVLHGGPGMLNHGYLLPQMLEVALDNQVTFYDQRGSGRSLGFALNKETINVDNFVKDLEAVRKKLGYEKFTLMGHSWGGLLAMEYALAYPQCISGLILVSSAPHSSAGFKVFITEYERRVATLSENLTKLQSTEKFKQHDPAALSEYFREIFSVYFYEHDYVNQLSLPFTKEGYLSGAKVFEIVNENYFSNYDLTEQLKHMNLPVLIVHGKNDVVPLSTARATKRAIPKAKIVVLKHCDHFPYIEKPKEFFRAINNFLSAL